MTHGGPKSWKKHKARGVGGQLVAVVDGFSACQTAPMIGAANVQD